MVRFMPQAGGMLQFGLDAVVEENVVGRGTVVAG